MRTIAAPACLPDPEVAKLLGTKIDESHIDCLISGEAVTVTKPQDGSPLLIYRPDVLPPDLCSSAFDTFKRVKVGTRNRGLAAGEIDALLELDGLRVGKRSRTRFNPFKSDGTISKTTYAPIAPSGIVGFWDRSPRNPFCRMTAFNLKNPDRFRKARPFISAVDRVFAEMLPDRYAAQKDAIERTASDFTIRDTAFTTITVNRNFQTAVHADKGDLKAGFGVMAVLDYGSYDGGYLVSLNHSPSTHFPGPRKDRENGAARGARDSTFRWPVASC